MNRTSELVLPVGASDALPRIQRAMSAVGSIKSQTSDYLEGRASYGLQSVRVRISWAAEGETATRVIIQAWSDDVWGAGAKSAAERIETAIRNAHVPGYAPDRLGMHPAALAGSLIAFVIVLAVVIPFVLRLIGH